jgi:UDP-glucose 4-epimerase
MRRADTDEAHEKFYSNKRVLVTGGLGFLGSSVANRLAAMNAKVTILDSLHPLYGGNRFNLDPAVAGSIDVVIGDVRDQPLVERLVSESEIIYHFAAQVSYIDSGDMPLDDLAINQTASLNLLEACRNSNSNAKVLFASSRLVLGETKLPAITESHPTDPLSMYAVHKLAVEKYCYLYYKNYGIATTVLRITNPYGPRQQIKHNKYSMVGWFIRLAMEDKEIPIFGDGNQRRNYIYIDDIVEAFIRCGASTETNGQLYFVGSQSSDEFRSMAEFVVASVGKGKIRYVPWPANYERVETGDVRIDTSKLTAAIQWHPEFTLSEGISRTYEYYAQHWKHYIDG